MIANAIPNDRGLIEALHTSGPSEEHTDKLMLFGQFVGSWDIAWSGTDADGNPAHANGELYFGWVLNGRAVQDIWIVPRRDEPVPSQTLRRLCGTTVRFYDHALDAWRSTWINPGTGQVRRFIGRPVNGEIVLLSDEQDPWQRWWFTDITAESANWRGEVSHDQGGTWTVVENMRLTRMSR